MFKLFIGSKKQLDIHNTPSTGSANPMDIEIKQNIAVLHQNPQPSTSVGFAEPLHCPSTQNKEDFMDSITLVASQEYLEDIQEV